MFSGQHIFNNYFKPFDFIEWFDLNSHSSFSVSFCLCISWLTFYHYDLIHQLLLQTCNHENKDQVCSLEHYWVCILSPSNAYFIDFNTACLLVLITSCRLNPILFFKLHNSSVLRSIITFNAQSLRQNLLLGSSFGWSINPYLWVL